MSKKINITIDTNSLVSTMQNCKLGLGTYDDPIAADYYATNLSEENTSINLENLGVNEMGVTFTVSNNNSGPEPKLLDVFFNIVGSNDVVLPDSNITNIYDQVFDCSNSNIIIEGRTLCVSENNGNCDVMLTSNTGNNYENSYFTYSILFELAVNGIPYCFSVDPILSIRSRRRRR